MLAGELGNTGRVGPVQLLGPLVPVAVLLGLHDRRPDRELLQLKTVLITPGLELDIGLVLHLLENPLERLDLQCPDRIAVDETLVVERATPGVEIGQVDPLGTERPAGCDMQQVQEEPGCRRVGRGLRR